MTAAVRKRRKVAEPIQASLPFQLPEGIHLRLPERFYFASRAIGSSDFPTLAADPHSYWYGSANNADRGEARRRDNSTAFGSALHALVLEGEDAYRSRFVIQPDPGAQYAETRREMLALLRDRGVFLARGDFDDRNLHALIRRHNLGHRVREVAEADFRSAKRKGVAHVTSDEDRRLRHMAHLISTHEDLGPGLREGMAEVSIFWRTRDRPEILRRARFDRLLIKATVDLKSFANARGKTPAEAAWDAIADFDYDVQAENYREARMEIGRFLDEGRVYSWGHGPEGEIEGAAATPADLKFLEDVAAAGDAWIWIWIFYQVRNDAPGHERAPVIEPFWTRTDTLLFADARREIERALDNYERLVGEFGLDRPWTQISKIRELPLARLKRLQFKRNPA